MKCLGLVSADCLDQAADCGSRITEEVQHRLGKQSHANLVAVNLHTSEIAGHTRENDWLQLAARLGEAVDWVKSVGAELLVPCSTNLHLAAESLSPKLPNLHIADPTAAALRRARVKRIGLVGWPASRKRNTGAAGWRWAAFAMSSPRWSKTGSILRC